MVQPSLDLKRSTNIKFMCSYGGRIVPRHPDGKLRYNGGETRVLAVDRSISFSELMMKMGELCGEERVSLRCQLPKEDLDALVSVTSDEDLSNLIEEYDRSSTPKIRAILSLPKRLSSSSLSTSSSSSSSSSNSSNNRYPRGHYCFYINHPKMFLPATKAKISYYSPVKKVLNSTDHAYA